MLKKTSLALLTQVVQNFKNAEAPLSLLGWCSKDEKLLLNYYYVQNISLANDVRWMDTFFQIFIIFRLL